MPKRLTESIEAGQLDVTVWSSVLEESLSDTNRLKFSQRKAAIEMYVTGELSIREISENTGIGRQEIIRLFKRCVELDGSGQPWGWRALIPNKAVKKYARRLDVSQRSRGFGGAFNQLLDKYPTLQDNMINYYFKKSRNVHEPVPTVKYLHKQFLRWCRELGIQMNEYPFTTKSLGKRSVERYVKRLEQLYFVEASARSGEESRRRARVFDQQPYNRNRSIRPFECVQFDGHRIDAIVSITFDTLNGDEQVKTMERMWLLVIVDVSTRAILGYHLSFNEEYTALDVMKCIRNAIVPWEPMKFQIPGLKYPDGAGYHSGYLPDTKWAVWDEFQYDNGKANLSKLVITQLTETVGCTVNPGPVKTPERRAVIERLFKTLEENGYHRLPSTTGSNPSDPRRQSPETKAIKYKISAEHLIELTEVLIAQYNLSPHEANDFLTPLEAMEQRLLRSHIETRRLPEDKRDSIKNIYVHAKRTVLGSIERGKRPYIQFQGVSYRNDVLSKSPGLIGHKLSILINPDDIRVVRAYLPDGSEFGLLEAAGKWGIIAHSLEMRKQINLLRQRKLLHFTAADDPVDVYLTYLQESSKNSKRARNKLHKVRQLAKSKTDETREIQRQRPIESDNLRLTNNASTLNDRNASPLTAVEPPLMERKLKKTITF